MPNNEELIKTSVSDYDPLDTIAINTLIQDMLLDIDEMITPLDEDETINLFSKSLKENKGNLPLKNSIKRRCIVNDPEESSDEHESLTNPTKKAATSSIVKQTEKTINIFSQMAIDYLETRLSKEDGLLLFCGYFQTVLEINTITAPLKLIEKTNHFSLVLPPSVSNHKRILEHLNLFSANGLGMKKEPFSITSNDYKTRIILSKKHQSELARRIFLLTMFGADQSYFPPLALTPILRNKTTGQYFHCYFSDKQKLALISSYNDNQISFYEDQQQFPDCLLLDKANYLKFKINQLNSLTTHEKLRPLKLDDLIALCEILTVPSDNLKLTKQSIDSMPQQTKVYDPLSKNVSTSSCLVFEGFFAKQKTCQLSDDLMRDVKKYIVLDDKTRLSLIAGWFSPVLVNKQKNFPLILKSLSTRYQVRKPEFIPDGDIKALVLALNRISCETLGLNRNVFHLNEKNQIVLSKYNMYELSDRIEIASLFKLTKGYPTPLSLNRLIYHKPSTRLFHINFSKVNQVKNEFAARDISLITHKEFPNYYFIDEEGYLKFKAQMLEQLNTIHKLPHLSINYVRQLIAIVMPYVNPNCNLSLKGLESKLLELSGIDRTGEQLGYIPKA